MPSRPHPIDEIVRLMDRIYDYGMTTTSGGNLSIKDDEGNLWITPSQVDKGGLTAADIVCVRPDGRIEGKHKPSSEYPFHLRIYQARPDLRGIVHAHVPALSAYAIANQVPDTLIQPTARAVCGTVGFSRYAIPGSDLLGDLIAEAFTSGSDCVEMANHGFVVGGESLQQAFERMETLEHCAKLTLKARTLGTPRVLSEAEYLESQRGAYLLPEFQPPLANHREMELRHQLCTFASRGYDQGLTLSTKGSMSVRLGKNAFLFTPSGKDRKNLRPEDIVLVKGGKREAGKVPSRACVNHLAIYKAHPEVEAIFNAVPVNTTAFAVTGETMDTRIIPESYIMLQDVPTIPYADQYGDGTAIATAITARTPVLLFAHNGALAVGKSLLQAFDRMEVLEATAKVLINAKPLGATAQIADKDIEEIRTVWMGGR